MELGCRGLWSKNSSYVWQNVPERAMGNRSVMTLNGKRERDLQRRGHGPQEVPGRWAWIIEGVAGQQSLPFAARRGTKHLSLIFLEKIPSRCANIDQDQRYAEGSGELPRQLQCLTQMLTRTQSLHNRSLNKAKPRQKREHQCGNMRRDGEANACWEKGLQQMASTKRGLQADAGQGRLNHYKSP